MLILCDREHTTAKKKTSEILEKKNATRSTASRVREIMNYTSNNCHCSGDFSSFQSHSRFSNWLERLSDWFIGLIAASRELPPSYAAYNVHTPNRTNITVPSPSSSCGLIGHAGKTAVIAAVLCDSGFHSCSTNARERSAMMMSQRHQYDA